MYGGPPCDINHPDPEGRTILLNACYDVPGGPHDGAVEIIRKILQLGANPDKGRQTSHGNYTPVSVIMQRIDIVTTQIAFFNAHNDDIKARQRALKDKIRELSMTTPSDKNARYERRKVRKHRRTWLDNLKRREVRARREIRKLVTARKNLQEILRVLYFAGAELVEPTIPLALSRHPYLTQLDLSYKFWPIGKARLPTARAFGRANPS
jgi:hypothetical protein